jgi:hypothetical protein
MARVIVGHILNIGGGAGIVGEAALFAAGSVVRSALSDRSMAANRADIVATHRKTLQNADVVGHHPNPGVSGRPGPLPMRRISPISPNTD